MDVLLVVITAFFASLLTFFSGFGLGTLLTPIFLFFIPLEWAITCTGVVHLFNSLFKLLLLKKYANKHIFVLFGIPAMIAAVVGSWFFIHLANTQALFSYSLLGKTFTVYFIKFILGLLLMLFTLMELLPFINKLQFGREKLFLGGVISGFLGGLSGLQGALRTAFLIKVARSKDEFVATAALIAVCVDSTRIFTYFTQLYRREWSYYLPYMLFPTMAAIVGSYVGNALFKKVTIRFVQVVVTIFLMIFSLMLAMGII